MALRKASNAALSATSCGERSSTSAAGGSLSAEARGGRAGVDLALEAAQDDLLDAPSFGRLQLARLREADRVEDLEQPAEAAGVAVVRRRAQEQPVLESRRDQAQHPAQVAVLTEGRRHQVVTLVDNQQVPRQVRRSFGRVRRGQELLEHVVLPQVVVGGDDAAERAPGISVHPHPTPQFEGGIAIDQIEGERELLPHLVAPLGAERRQASGQAPAGCGGAGITR